MEVSTRKTIWWYALALGAGGTLLFGYAFLMEGPPSKQEMAIYIWPAVTLIFSTLAILRLRRCYREEPAGGGGFWQLSISDLMVAAFGFGLMLTVFKFFLPDLFLRIGVPVTLITTVQFIAGMLVATRRGIASRESKYAYAFGFTLRNYGLLGIGAALVFSVVIFLFEFDFRESYRFVRLLFFDHAGANEAQIILPLRTCFAMLPIGWWMCRTIEKQQSP